MVERATHSAKFGSLFWADSQGNWSQAFRLELDDGVGAGAHAWLIEAAAAGASRVRAKMARAVELAALVGRERVEVALAEAAAAGRFAEGDLPSILDYLAGREPGGASTALDEAFSVQPGTGAWEGFGR